MELDTHPYLKGIKITVCVNETTLGTYLPNSKPFLGLFNHYSIFNRYTIPHLHLICYTG